MKRKWILGKPFIPCDVKSQTKTYFLIKREKKTRTIHIEINRSNSKSSYLFVVNVSTLLILVIRKARRKKKLHRLCSQIGRTRGSVFVFIS